MKKKIHKQIFYRAPQGQEIIQIDGDYFVLDGWNEEVYLLSYKSNYFGARLDEDNYVIKPIYEADEFGNIDIDLPDDFEIVR